MKGFSGGKVLVVCSSSVGQSLLSCGNGSQHESFLNSTSNFENMVCKLKKLIMKQEETVGDYLAKVLINFSFHSVISRISKSDDRIVFLTHFDFCRDFLHFGTVS